MPATLSAIGLLDDAAGRCYRMRWGLLSIE